MSRNPEKFTTKQVGSTLKTLFVGSILRGHKRKTYRCGKRNRVQSSQTARCHLTALSVWSHNEVKLQFMRDLRRQGLHHVLLSKTYLVWAAAAATEAGCFEELWEIVTRHCPRPHAWIMLRKRKTRFKSISEFMEYPNVFSEESKRKLKEMGNIELYELGETVRTTQCLACLRNSKEGANYCGCGECLILSQEHTDKIKRRIDFHADPLFVVERRKTGERHGPEEWQYHHWKAVDAAKNCKKREYESIAKRLRDDLSYWDTQQEHGWTRILHVPGLPQDDQDQLQGCSRRTRLIQKSTCIEVEKIRRTRVIDVNSIRCSRSSEITRIGGLPTRTRKRPHSSTSKTPTKTHYCAVTLSTPRRMPAMESIRGTQALSSSSTTWWTPQQCEELQQCGERHQWQERQVTLQISLPDGRFFLFGDISCADIGECGARDGVWWQNTSPYAAHTHIFLVAPCSTVFHIFTFHPMDLHWLKAWWFKSACEPCVKNLALAPHLVATFRAWASFYFSWRTGDGIWDPLHRSRRRWLVWPNGWTVPAHRSWAQEPGRDLQPTHADHFSFQEKQFQHRLQRRAHHCRVCWHTKPWMRERHPRCSRKKEKWILFCASVHQQVGASGSSNPQQPASPARVKCWELQETATVCSCCWELRETASKRLLRCWKIPVEWKERSPIWPVSSPKTTKILVWETKSPWLPWKRSPGSSSRWMKTSEKNYLSLKWRGTWCKTVKVEPDDRHRWDGLQW